MCRLHRPRGLIRYDSQTAFSGKPTRWFRPRTILYAVLLAIGAGVAGTALSTVRPANLDVTRITGAPYIIDKSFVRNQFFVRLVNKRNEPARFQLQLHQAPTSLRQTGFGTAFEIPPLGEIVQPLVLQQSRKDYTGPFTFEVTIVDDRGRFSLSRAAEFLGPEARLLREEEDEEHEHSRKHD